MLSEMYKLGNLVEDLEKADVINYSNNACSYNVEFEDGEVPGVYLSDRGDYSNLAILKGNNKPIYGMNFYIKSFNAIHSLMVGYKGGLFHMTKDKIIYIANEANSSSNGDYISGIKIDHENSKILLLVTG